jgi:hypothetical protein
MFGKIKLTPFSLRHFDKKFSGTKITDVTPEEFEEKMGEYIEAYDDVIEQDQANVQIMNGYAPFCKLIAIPNFTNARVGTMKIDMANYQYLRSGYSARTPNELPVFSRWFELPLAAPVAEWLIVVVYSKEQIDKESESTAIIPEHVAPPFEADWGVVAILGQSHPNEEPMPPATMLRNALGMSEGGSGVPIDREAYAKSVTFWSEHAIVKS